MKQKEQTRSKILKQFADEAERKGFILMLRVETKGDGESGDFSVPGVIDPAFLEALLKHGDEVLMQEVAKLCESEALAFGKRLIREIDMTCAAYEGKVNE